MVDEACPVMLKFLRIKLHVFADALQIGFRGSIGILQSRLLSIRSELVVMAACGSNH